MQNPKLGDSILLGETRWRLSVTGGRGQTRGVSPTLLPNLPVLGPWETRGPGRGAAPPTGQQKARLGQAHLTETLLHPSLTCGPFWG